MKLVYYELKKIWTSASVLKLAFFMILVSSAIFIGELRENRDWLPEYLNYHKALDTVETNELQQWLVQEEKELESEPAWNERDAKRNALACIEKEIDAVVNYDAYREEIQTRYEESSSFSIFADSDNTQKAYIRKIAETYRNLQVRSPIQLESCKGIQIFLEFYGGDLLWVVFLIYLVSSVFLQEERNGKQDFLYTMARGRNLFVVKTAAVCISMTIYMAIVFLLNLLFVEMSYGLPFPGAAVQSIPELYSVPYPWTIGQYLSCWFCLKLVAAFGLAALAIALMRWSSSDVITAIGVCGFLGGCVWCHSYLIGDGLQAVLRFWNPWSLLRGINIIGTYELICFPSGVVEVIRGVPLIFILTLLLLYLSGKIRKSEIKCHTYKRWEMAGNPHGLLFYEFKKLWIRQGGIALFCFCIVIQGVTVNQYRDYFGTEEYYYHQYIDRFGNRVTNDTEEKILEERTRLDNLQKALEKETDFVYAYKLQKDLECRAGFEKYADRLYGLQHGNKENIILKDAQYRLLFDFTEVSGMMVILISMSMAFLIPGVFQKEKETGMDMIQKTTARGGRSLWRSKIGVLLFYVIALILGCAFFSYFKAVRLYDLILEAPLNCLEVYWKNHISISVKTAYWCGVMLQCMVVTIIIVILSACARKVKSRYAMTGVILSAGVIPTILSVTIPLKWLRWIHDALFVFTNKSVFLWVILAVCALIALRIMQKETIR